MRISDWSSDVCSSDLSGAGLRRRDAGLARGDDPRRADGGGRVVPVAAGGDPDRVLRRARRRRIADRAGRAAAVLIAVSLVAAPARRSEEHTSELQSLMRISYAVFCLKKKNNTTQLITKTHKTKINGPVNKLLII